MADTEDRERSPLHELADRPVFWENISERNRFRPTRGQKAGVTSSSSRGPLVCLVYLYSDNEN